jgi:hypothetical protein
MNSGQYIQERQRAWARRKGIELRSAGTPQGNANYTQPPLANILGGELLAEVREQYAGGAGGEFLGDTPSGSALHSSAALTLNLFQYWVRLGELQTAARLLDVPTRNIVGAGFQAQFPVCSEPRKRGFNRPPHLDFALSYRDGSRVGVECKMFEPFGRAEHAALSPKYLDLPDTWSDIPAWRTLAERLTGTDTCSSVWAPASSSNTRWASSSERDPTLCG